MTTKGAAMHRYIVEFEVDVPASTETKDALEWIAYAVGARSDMQLSNPLCDTDIEPVRGSFLSRRKIL